MAYPKDVHISNPKTYERVALYEKQDFEDMLK